MTPLGRMGVVVALAVVAYVGFRVWKASSLSKASTRMAESETARLLFFVGPNCSQCAAQRTVIDSVKEQFPEVQFERYDASVDTKMASDAGVLSVPTTVIIDSSGTVVQRNGRYVGENVLVDQLSHVANI